MKHFILALSLAIAGAPQMALAQHYAEPHAKVTPKPVKPAFDATTFFTERALSSN